MSSALPAKEIPPGLGYNDGGVEQIGRYRVLGEVGRGAMGIVYRAEDPAIGRTVAIKTIRLGEVADEKERQFMRERLLREARSAGILSHPGIVTIYDISEQGDTAYIFMEYVHGTTLDKLVTTQGKLEKEKILDVLRQTADALDYAHSKGIVHRDIKPANIMVSSDGEAKITDFGVAKILSQQLTQTRAVLGTPYYMSPEQIQGAGVDGRTDQYALGVVAYELLTGERPFTADSLPTLLFRIVREPPPPPRRLNPTLPREVDAVFEKVFAKRPEDRFPNCTEFIEALAAALERSPAWEPLSRKDAEQMTTAAASPPSPDLQDAAATEGHPELPAAEPQRPALPKMPRTRPRERDWDYEEEPTHFLRNTVLVLLVLGIAGAGAWYYQDRLGISLPGIPMEEAPAETAVESAAQPVAQQPPAPAEAEGTGSEEPPAAGAASPAAVPEPPPGQNPAAAGESTAAAGPPAAEPSSAPPEVSPPPPAESTAPPESKPAPPKTPQVYWVQIRSNPPGGRVNADDDPELVCRTPCELPLEEGRHVITVTMAGHQVGKRIIRVPDITDVTVNLDRRAGTLAVVTRPPGATIIINGERRPEKTPAMIKLPEGKHHVRLELPGHQPVEEEVEIRDQAIRTFRVEW